MKITIAKPTDLTEDQIEHFRRIIDFCNSSDGTAYTFDPGDDYSRADQVDHFILYGDGVPLSAVYLFVPTSSEAEVYGFTLPEYRGRGYFSRLLIEVEAEAKRRSVGSLLFVCDRNSEAGKEFLRKRGVPCEYSEYAMVWTGEDMTLPSMDVSLRPVLSEDRDQLARINSEAFNDERSEAESIIDLFITSELRDFYTILHKGSIVGMIGRYLEDGRDYIHGFCLDRDFRGRGFGRQALLWMVALCRRTDPSRRIELEVETENEKALGLYKSCGFELQSVFGYYRSNPGSSGKGST